MLKRILFFTKPYQLRLENSQLVVEDKSSRNVVDSIPIEDIGHVILEHPQIAITMPSLNAFSDNNVAVIFCGDNRMPKSMLMHLDSNSTMSETYKAQRRDAALFRKSLENDGFRMMQLSVYIRHCFSKENMDVHIKRVKSSIPSCGLVSILSVTDKQYGEIKNFWGAIERNNPQKPQQLTIF